MEMKSTSPILLSPVGDFERLEMALHYGADAVYLAGREFGMRASAGNFDAIQLEKAIALCHSQGVQVHVTCNTTPREDEIARLPAFLEQLETFGADAVIIADLGVFGMAKTYAPHVEIHASTQLGVTNSATASMLYDMGASCAVLARELNLEEIAAIRAATPKKLALEGFVHGAMCVSFSGRCLLSNYLTGRDANRGACAQPCRWTYYLVEQKRPGERFEIFEDKGTHILNSRDMCMIDHLPELLDAGVTSLKIEGRMKSAYYCAAVTNAYRNALDAALAGMPLDPVWVEEVNKVSHRPYSTGFYFGEPGQYYPDSMYFSDADVCAIVESCDAEGNARLTQRNRFFVGDTVELLVRGQKPIRFVVEAMQDGEGNAIESAPHPMMQLRMKLPVFSDRLSILRKLK
jgi:putative protease